MSVRSLNYTSINNVYLMIRLLPNADSRKKKSKSVTLYSLKILLSAGYARFCFTFLLARRVIKREPIIN